MRTRRFKWWLKALSVGTAVVLLGLLGLKLYQWAVAPAVWVTEAVEGPVVQAFYATGTLLPDREYPVRTSVEGIVAELAERVPEAARVDKGVTVRKGQPVAFVRAREYQMQFAQAEAELTLKRKLADAQASPVLAEFDARLKAAGEQLDISQRDFKRVSDLKARSAASESDYDRAAERVQEYRKQVESLRAARATRQAELERDAAVAQAAADIAQWNLDQQTLKAPIDGVVLDRPVTPGTHLRVNDLVLTVADVRPEKLVMRANVDEEDKTRLTLGQPVRMTLYAYPGRVFSGTVTMLYPKADPDRRTFEVDVRIEPVDERFAAGMTGELAFEVERRAQALVVPSQAVRLGEEPAAGSAGGRQGTVWVVNGERVQPREITLGLRSIERIEVREGLKAGERVLVSPPDGLKPQQAVTVKYMDPAQAAGLNKKPEEKAMRMN